MKLMVTGGAGFIGSNFIRYILSRYPSYHVLNFDKLTYAGNLENLKDVENNPRYRFIKGDIGDFKLVRELASEVDAIINFAAETHVDRSLKEPFSFIDTAMRGTYSLIKAAQEAGHERYIQISTDEVFGDWEQGKATESSPYRPSSPYSASKAGGDHLVQAAHRSFGFPGIVTNCTNNYGPYQYPEKLIPLFITNIIEGKPLPVYGDGQQIRDWLFVEDHCSAIDLVLHKGREGENYVIGAEQDPELTNLDVAKKLLSLCGADGSLLEYVSDRPGHDRRYAVDSFKIRQLGWVPSVTFDEGIKQTVDWYRTHQDWWKSIKSGEYARWYQEQYTHE